MAKKFDGVIEAVRYKNGQIETVRAYERRGAAFSDRVLIDRKELLEHIKDGKQFVVGARKEFWAGTFDEAKAVQLVTRAGKDFIATRPEAEHDELESALIF